MVFQDASNFVDSQERPVAAGLVRNLVQQRQYVMPTEELKAPVGLYQRKSESCSLLSVGKDIASQVSSSAKYENIFQSASKAISKQSRESRVVPVNSSDITNSHTLLSNSMVSGNRRSEFEQAKEKFMLGKAIKQSYGKRT